MHQCKLAANKMKYTRHSRYSKAGCYDNNQQPMAMTVAFSKETTSKGEEKKNREWQGNRKNVEINFWKNEEIRM